MTVTIVTGWWLVPAFVTFLAFVVAGWLSQPDGPLYPKLGGFEALILPVAALFVSALAWGAYLAS